MTPFVLKGRTLVSPESAPSDCEIYCRHRQLWIDQGSGEPLIRRIQDRVQPSQFGETTITETREGADQSEVTRLTASQFGETTITKTQEGADQSEITHLWPSQSGETTLTATIESDDQNENDLLHYSQFGETTVTRTREGHDQSEATSAPVSHDAMPSREGDSSGDKTLVTINAPYSHF